MTLRNYLIAVFAALLAFTATACNDDTVDPLIDPDVEVDATVTPSNGTIIVARVTAEDRGWIVIHRDNGNNAPNTNASAVVGYAAVDEGINENVTVTLTESVTDDEKLWAVLFNDDGVEGTFEFTGAGSPDQPATEDGSLITESFIINVGSVATELNALDQITATDSVRINTANVGQSAWLVIYRDNGSNAPLMTNSLGRVRLSPGQNANVRVGLSQAVDTGDKLWAVIHTDTGVIGTFEYTGAGSPDQPMTSGGQVVRESFMIL